MFDSRTIAQHNRKVAGSPTRVGLSMLLLTAVIAGFVAFSVATTSAKAEGPDASAAQTSAGTQSVPSNFSARQNDLSLNMTEFTAKPEGDTAVFEITTNASWTLTKPAWINVFPSSGTGPTMSLLVVEANTTGLSRSGAIIVTTDSGVSRSTAVTQISRECGTTRFLACAWPDVSKSVSGVIDTSGDKDWFKFVPTVSGPWTFKSFTNGLTNPVGTIYDADGRTVLASNTGGAAQGQFSVTAPLTAGYAYYVEIKGSVAAQTGTYTLTAAQTAASLSLSPASVAAPARGMSPVVAVSSNTTWSISIPPEVSGWVSSTVHSGTGDRSSVPVYIQANTTGVTRSAVVTFATTSGSPVLSRAFTITQEALECGTTISLYCLWGTVAKPMNGVIDTAGDRDWYRFTVPESGVWTFTSSTPAVNGLADPYGTLYSNIGTPIASDDNSAGDHQFFIGATLIAGQSYYLEIRGAGSASTGAYTVTAGRNTPSSAVSSSVWTPPAGGVLQSVAQDAPGCGGSMPSSCPWSDLSRPVSGAIAAVGAQYWVKFVAPSSGPWTFTSSRPAVNGLTDPYGIMYSSNGTTLIAYDYRGANNGQFKISVVLTAGQTYYLQVRDNLNALTGDFTVTAAQLAVSLSVSPGLWSAPAGGGVVQEKITTNTNWSVSKPADVSWLTVNVASGYGNSPVRLRTQANTTGATRSCVVTFTTTIGTPNVTQRVTVIQPPQNAVRASTAMWNAAAMGQTQTISVTSNEPWAVTYSPAWVSVAESGADDDLILTAQPNTTGKLRVGVVMITDGSDDPEGTSMIQVSQPG